MCSEVIYSMYKEDLALNNLQWFDLGYTLKLNQIIYI